jgi:hypothetical protein
MSSKVPPPEQRAPDFRVVYPVDLTKPAVYVSPRYGTPRFWSLHDHSGLGIGGSFNPQDCLLDHYHPYIDSCYLAYGDASPHWRPATLEESSTAFLCYVLELAEENDPELSREGVSQPLQQAVAVQASATPTQGAKSPCKAPAGLPVQAPSSRARSKPAQAAPACHEKQGTSDRYTSNQGEG